MKNDRPINTLFVISSLDGKISTGDVDTRDVDKDFQKIKGVKEGLQQYYKLEKKTDEYSFNTGKVMAKIGMNKPAKNIQKIDCSFIIVDNTHLKKMGVENLLRRVQTLYLVTKNKTHPAFSIDDSHLKIISYTKILNFQQLFRDLKKKHGIERITIQSGGTMNSTLLREGLIDRISLVVAPCLIGGKGTATLMDGTSLRSETDLKKMKTLKLKKVTKLKHSYLHLLYDVIR